MSFVCVFCSVVGPAVIFQVRPNTQNVSTADVANVAGRFSLSNVVFILTEIKTGHYHWLAAAPEAPLQHFSKLMTPR